MAKPLEPHALLAWARDLGRTVSFLDFHVHPFDVLTGDVAYHSNEQFEGVFSRGDLGYHAPIVDEKMESGETRPSSTPATERAFLLAARLKYAHTGSRVFADQIDAVGLSGALLLPVARTPGRAGEMLESARMMFASDSRLYAGCPFPVGVPADDIAEFFCSARENYGIRAIKIHPNLIGLDPLARVWHDLIEVTLVAAGKLGLPVIVHGGCIAALKPSAAAEYGMLSRLETINWSLSSAPVVIAHAGCFDLTGEDANAALSKLDALFEKHPNLMADTSSLDAFTLRLVLQKVSHERLVFGSDALYVSIWKAWLGFLQALREVSPAPDDDLVRIASVNPANCLGTPSTR